MTLACFNGAAAKSSGKCVSISPVSLFVRGFNGAAAKSSGKCDQGVPKTHTRMASMGPPLKAAENTKTLDHASTRTRRFNGAAAKSSGK